MPKNRIAWCQPCAGLVAFLSLGMLWSAGALLLLLLSAITYGTAQRDALSLAGLRVEHDVLLKPENLKPMPS